MLVCSTSESENTEVCTSVSNRNGCKYDEGLMLVFNEVSNGDSSEYDESSTPVSNKDTTGLEDGLMLLSNLDNSVKVKGLFTDPKEDTSEDTDTDTEVWTVVSHTNGSENGKGLVLVSSKDDSDDEEGVAIISNKDKEVWINISNADDSKDDERLISDEVSNGDSSEYDESLTIVSNEYTFLDED